jgi:hypothetical protein
MSLREKIILFIAGLAVIWGAYELGIKNILQKNSVPSEKKKTQTELEQDLSLFTRQISDQVSSVNLNKKEILIISKSREKVKKDPFISFYEMESIENKGELDKKTPGAPAVQSLYKYLGYIEINNNKMAVINNLEYTENEQIEGSRYILKKISPLKVVLSDGSKSIEIFNEETKTRVE